MFPLPWTILPPSSNIFRWFSPFFVYFPKYPRAPNEYYKPLWPNSFAPQRHTLECSRIHILQLVRGDTLIKVSKGATGMRFVLLRFLLHFLLFLLVRFVLFLLPFLPPSLFLSTVLFHHSRNRFLFSPFVNSHFYLLLESLHSPFARWHLSPPWCSSRPHYSSPPSHSPAHKYPS